MSNSLIIAIFGVLLSGCVACNIPSYSSDKRNLETIGKRSTKFNLVASKPSFDDTGKSLCRMVGDVAIPQEKTFTNYLIDGLREELKAQGVLDEKSDNSIEVKFSRVSFSSTLGSTLWLIEADYTFNSIKHTVSTVYNMDSNFVGNVACQNIAANFPNAAAKHFLEFYKSKVFSVAAGEVVTPATAVDLDVKLGKLKKALQDGLITEEEFKAKRSQIIREY